MRDRTIKSIFILNGSDTYVIFKDIDEDKYTWTYGNRYRNPSKSSFQRLLRVMNSELIEIKLEPDGYGFIVRGYRK